MRFATYDLCIEFEMKKFYFSKDIARKYEKGRVRAPL